MKPLVEGQRRSNFFYLNIIEETKKVQNLLKNDRTNASHGDIIIIIIIVRMGRFVVYS